MIDPRFVILGALISFCGTITYIRDTIKGRIKPNKVSWFLWGTVPLIAFAAEIDQGVGIQSLLTFMSGFSPFLVFLASFVNKNAYWKIGRFDLICGALSVLGIVLWACTRIGNTAILCSIMADGFAAIPIVVKAWRFPETESDTFFLLNIISNVLTLLSLPDWSFAYSGFPLYLLSCNAILVILIRLKPGLRAKDRFSGGSP